MVHEQTWRRISKAFPSVTSPKTLTASPGPGKGWRFRKPSGTFKIFPNARTLQSVGTKLKETADQILQKKESQTKRKVLSKE